MYAVRKFIRLSGSFKERLQIKSFRDNESMHKFLNSQYDNTWAEVTDGSRYPTRSGVYAFVGGKWCDVVTLDLSTLAHV